MLTETVTGIDGGSFRILNNIRQAEGRRGRLLRAKYLLTAGANAGVVIGGIHGGVAKSAAFGFTANAAGFRFFTGGGKPVMSKSTAFGFAANAAGFRLFAGGGHPVMFKSAAFGFAANAAGFGGFAGSGGHPVSVGAGIFFTTEHQDEKNTQCQTQDTDKDDQDAV